MIMDCHTHIAQSQLPNFQHMNMEPEQFASHLSARGIGKALVFPYDSLFNGRNYSEANDELAAFCARVPTMLIPYGSVNPSHGAAALDELTRMIQDLGFKGIKLHPWIQAFSFLANEYMDPFLQEVRRLHVPIIMHDGTPPYCTPSQYAYQAERYPQTTFVLGHAGLKDFWPESMQVALDHKNVMLNLNATFLGVQHIVQKLGGDRIVWGSDFPFGGVEVVDYWLGHILQLPVAEEVKDKILWRNGQVLLEGGL
jgi:predicted TIM-barrel fold metal-dependent hydrolase